ncbi:MAG: endonuclease/exonuclease/phosphatase family protein [Bacteroides sp.]
MSVEAFKEKALSVSRALRLMAGHHPLGLIGLCEVDSHRVLKKLIYQTPLKQGNYRILHHGSPDHRGIDVALLYQGDLLQLHNVRWLTIHLPSETSVYPTRELLYASFLLPNADTLHIIQCHLPSQMTARVNPVVVPAVLAQLQRVLDPVRSVSPQARIVVMRLCQNTYLVSESDKMCLRDAMHKYYNVSTKY